MAIAATVLDSGIDTTDAASYATASISPAANSLLLVFAASSDTTTAPTITASGLSLTWTTEKDQPFGSSTTDVRRLAAFSAQCGASPGSGAITLTMSATSTHVAWLVIEITGHDTTTPIPQVVSGKDDSTGATNLPLTLAAPVDADSRAFSWWGVRDNVNSTPQTGWTELYDMVIGSPSMAHEGQWRSDAFDTAADFTPDLPQRVGGIALEVAAGSAGPVDGSITAVVVTATAGATSPVVSGETAVNASAWAQATALVLAPVVTGAGGVITPAVAAQATSTALAPVVTGVIQTDASTTAVAAAATALFKAPVASGQTAVSAAEWAQATAQAHAPLVLAGEYVLTFAVAAGATSEALAPAVTATKNATVEPFAATATAAIPTPTPVFSVSVTAVVVNASAQGHHPDILVRLFFTFEPPTYEQPAPPPPGVRRSLYGLIESMSVVRINGTLQTVKSPFAGVLTTAGVEGEDYFLGGRVYQVPPLVALELINAGYTVT